MQRDATFRGFRPGMVVFGRFRLVEIIGRGGMGVVWKAEDTKLSGEHVALKFLPEALVWDSGARKQLREETQLSRRLTHPHIVRIHDLFEDEFGLAIGMEWVDGMDMNCLRSERPNGVLEPAEIEIWFDQWLAALDYAHGEGGTVHRDLKPSNLLLGRDGRLKVGDFGVACGVAETMMRVSSYSTAGTLAYMSPQQYDGDPPTAADDWYAVGATVYDLITGRPPFFRGAVADQIRSRRPESMTVRREQLGVGGGAVDSRWERLVEACLAKAPEDRPQSGAEARSLLTTGAIRKTEKARVTAESQLWFGHRALWLLAALVAVVATAGIIWRGDRAEFAASKPVEIAEERAAKSSAPYVATSVILPLLEDASDFGTPGLNFEHSGIEFPNDNGGEDGAVFRGFSWLQSERAEVLAIRAVDSVRVSFDLWPDAAAIAGGQTVFALERQAVGDFHLGMSLDGRNLLVLARQTQETKGTEVFAEFALRSGDWNRVEIDYRPGLLRLSVDGRIVAESHELVEESGENAPAALRIGASPVVGSGFVGRLRNFRLERFERGWDHAAAANSGHRLATWPNSVDGDVGAVQPFAISNATVQSAEDIPALVRSSFGNEVSLADWGRFKPWLEAQPDPAVALDRLGMPFQENAFVLRGGQRWYEGERQYFITRLNGRVPDYYLAHDTAADALVALGSWYGVTMRMLLAAPEGRALLSGEEVIDSAALPLPVPWRWLEGDERRVGASGDDLLIASGTGRLELGRTLRGVEGADNLALAVRGRWEASQWGSAISLYFLYDDGWWRSLRAEVSDTRANVQAFLLEDANGKNVRREQPLDLSEQEMVLILSPADIHAMARRVTDGKPMFSENSRMESAGRKLVRCGLIIEHRSGPPLRLKWLRLRASGMQANGESG